MKNYNVARLVSELGLLSLETTPKSLERVIEIPEISRPGLELAGFDEYYEPKRIIILGNKEIAFIKQLNIEDKRERFDFLTNDLTPLIIITRDNDCPSLLKEMAHQKNFPIVQWPYSTSRLLIKIYNMLDAWFAPKTSLHGTMLLMNGKGVFIKGPSGIGKSEIALELIKRGHTLIADDYVEIYQHDNGLVGKSPEIIRNLLEIRGVGIIDITKLFGYGAAMESNQIDYIIQLEKWDDKQSYERIGSMTKIEKILDVEVPKLVLPVTEGRSLSDVIEVAITNLKLKEIGYDSAKEFEKRINSAILGGK